MTQALAYFELYGPPVLLAAVPGFVAFWMRRPWFGRLQIAFAVLIVILPAYFDAGEGAAVGARRYYFLTLGSV
jgi:hypothetical protein